MTPESAELAGANDCAKFSVHRPGETDAITPFGLCVAEIDRGFLRFDWSRVTLTGLDRNVQCVRLAQSNGRDLGYYGAGDRPNRAELELSPVQGSVRFLVSDDPGGATNNAQALGNSLGNYDLELTLFNRRCQELCRTSRGETTVSFLRGKSKPVVRFSETSEDDCGLIGARAPSTWNQGGGRGGSDAASAAGTGVNGSVNAGGDADGGDGGVNAGGAHGH